MSAIKRLNTILSANPPYLPSTLQAAVRDQKNQLFDDFNVKVTCFFLGWIAEKFPDLVRTASKHGHEIASHGYAHQSIYAQTPEEFSEDITKAKEVLDERLG